MPKGKGSRMPDPAGHFGPFGGRYVAETLMSALIELEKAYRAAWRDRSFHRELDGLLKSYAGRPTPLYFAKRLTEKAGGARIYIKREDLAHTGSHKINNTLGQGLLARRMGIPCEIYMGEEDVRRQSHNVFRMRLLGARVNPVTSGSRTLKDAMNEALRDWVTNVRTTYYLIGSTAGPHPYPEMVRNFQSVIGREALPQFRKAEGKLPTAIVACVGGGSNAMGIFSSFLKYPRVRLYGVEAGGLGLSSGKHGATLSRGKVGVLHGSKSYLLQDANGQILEAHSISAGLDYPGVGPEHAALRDSGRAVYVAVDDQRAVSAFHRLSELEGIIPALESAHAIAWLLGDPAEAGPGSRIVVCLSGRGDKDVQSVAEREAGAPGPGA